VILKWIVGRILRSAILTRIFVRIFRRQLEEPPEYVYGTPSIEESNKLWKRSPHDSEIEWEEYEDAANSLLEHLRKRYTVDDGEVDGELYVRGDFFGDRTQYIELCKPEVFSKDFIEHLQLWLQEYEDGAWRILIPTYVGDAETPFVYPYIVRLGSEYDINSDESYSTIARMMRAFQNKEDATIV
jgi:hypothetical protein